MENFNDLIYSTGPKEPWWNDQAGDVLCKKGEQWGKTRSLDLELRDETETTTTTATTWLEPYTMPPRSGM